MAWSRVASDELHERALRFVRAFARAGAPPEPFDALAVDVARYQATEVPGFARLCAARGVDPSSFRTAADIPAVPTEAFKVSRVAAFPEADTEVTFRTSGTTLGARGAHAMRRASTYDEAALAFGRWALTGGAPPLRLPCEVALLAPPPAELPESSLGRMMQHFACEFAADPATSARHFLRAGILDLEALDAFAASALVRNVPVLLLGTSLAFVHLLEALDGSTFRLPDGSRVMQTGGWKGQSREVAPEALRRDIALALGVAHRAVVSEYGMTELSSQFYEATLVDPAAAEGVYVEPPWARVVPVHPESLEPVPDGEDGIARIVDLMNVDSAVVVLAADRVRRVPGGFELRGRWPGASPRGCSIAVDEILGTAN